MYNYKFIILFLWNSQYQIASKLDLNNLFNTRLVDYSNMNSIVSLTDIGKFTLQWFTSRIMIKIKHSDRLRIHCNTDIAISLLCN